MQVIVLLLMLPMLIIGGLFSLIYTYATSVGDLLKAGFHIPLMMLGLILLYFAGVAFAHQNPDPDSPFVTVLERFGTFTVAGEPISTLLGALALIALVAAVILRPYRGL